MSDIDKNTPEEVDFSQLFKAIVNFFNYIFSTVGSIFIKLYNLFIFTIKLVINFYKIIVPLILISFLLGVYKESKSKSKFSSKMLVKTFFDSKYQLIDNLEYYNSLINYKNIEELQKVFNIDQDNIESLVSFDIQAGLETRNDLLKDYDNYVKEIDSSMTDLITFEDFIKNRELVSGNLFEITVVSEKKDVFKKLESGLKKSFANDYSITKKKKRDSIILIKKAAIINQIEQINKLKQTYVEVLEAESKNSNLNLAYGQIPMTEQISKTREFELLTKEIELKNDLRLLEEQKITVDEYYEIISSFQDTGTKYMPLTVNFKVIYPLGSLIVFFISFALWRFVVYVKNYE